MNNRSRLCRHRGCNNLGRMSNGLCFEHDDELRTKISIPGDGNFMTELAKALGVPFTGGPDLLARVKELQLAACAVSDSLGSLGMTPELTHLEVITRSSRYRKNL